MQLYTTSLEFIDIDFHPKGQREITEFTSAYPLLTEMGNEESSLDGFGRVDGFGGGQVRQAIA